MSPALLARAERTGRARADCPLCGGRGSVSLQRGRRVGWLVKCFKCTSDYPTLARALALPAEPRRRHGPPVRVESDWERAVADLLAAAEARHARLRPWLAGLDLSAEHRWELNAARECRELATLLGDCPLAWDLAEEAADRERRALLIALGLDVVRRTP